MKKRMVIFAFIGGYLLIITFEIIIQSKINKNIDQLLRPHLYANEFDESIFPCTKKSDQYQTLIAQGYKRIKEKRIAICGLARNIENNISNITKRIEQTGNLFSDYQVFIFENDSADHTRELLLDWEKQNNHVHLLQCDQGDCILHEKPLYDHGILSSKRIVKMAHFRNKYLNALKRECPNYDYMLVIDLDIKGPWSFDGLAHTVAQDKWDAVCAYGLHPLLGTFGLIYAVYDQMAYVKKDSNPPCTPLQIIKQYFYVNFYQLLGIQRGDDMIPVQSCFNGMAIYKIPSILNIEYGPGSCEHVTLHKQMEYQNRGKIFMNPNLILLSGHQGPPNVLRLFS